MLGILLVFLVVYTLNLIPAFAPPTWMVFSFIGFRYPALNLKLLALVGAAAATLGRVTLAKLAQVVIRQKFMSPSSRRNIDAIRQHLEGRRKFTAGIFLFYAFTPFPSNYLFIAYGLTAMPLRLIALPFLLGRTVSYSFWGFASSAVGRRLFMESHEALSYFSVYFILSQILLLSIVYGFTRVDWRAAFEERKFKWLGEARKVPRSSRS
jgi:membrane protein DedA with SNARE-associated domain